MKFETYAIARIKGSIIDELRVARLGAALGALARAPDRARDGRARGEARARADRRGDRGQGRHQRSRSSRTASTEISRSSIAALDELWTISGSGGDQVALIDTIEDEQRARAADALAQTELREALADAITRLPEREKLVVTLYYYEELTLREIGEVLGVTESRVSQLHTKAILRLKARLVGRRRACGSRLSSSARQPRWSPPTLATGRPSPAGRRGRCLPQDATTVDARPTPRLRSRIRLALRSCAGSVCAPQPVLIKGSNLGLTSE